MKNIMAKFNHPYFIWGTIILIAFIFYLTGITHESLWCDEAFSANMVEYSFFDILKNTAVDVHPPLYYVLLKILRIILGNSEWALRLLSVFGAVGMIGLGAGPVRRLFGDKTAYIYAAVVLFTPIILIMAHEVRMYSLVIFTATSCALYGLSVLKENKTGYWILFGISTLVSAYLHYYGLISVFFINLFLLIYILVKKRELLKNFIITAGIVLLTYLPWLIFFIGQIKKVDNAFWVTPVDISSIQQALLQPFYYKEFYPVSAQIDIFASALLLLLFVTIIVSLVLMARKKERQNFYMSLFLFSIYVCTFLGAIFISLILAPVFYRRYVIVCTGFLILPFCIGISSVKFRTIRLLLLASFMLLNINTIINVYTQKFNGLFYDIRNSLKDSIKPGDLIITSDCFCVSPSLYYFPGVDHYFYVNKYEKNWEFTFDAERSRFIKETDPKQVFQKYKSFWMINCNSIISVDVSDILKNEPGWEQVIKPKEFSHPYSKIAFSVSKYEYTGKMNTIKTGKMTIRIKDIRKNTGFLWVSLYKKDPVGDITRSFKVHFVRVNDKEMIDVFDNIEYGEYVLIIHHDENNDQRIEAGPDGVPKEGVYVYNYDPNIGLNLTFDKLKFKFSEQEKNIDIPMTYPPFDFLK